MPKTPVLTSREALKNHLNATSDDHNGNGWNVFVDVVDRPLRPTYKDIGDLFNVSGHTAKNWIEVFDLNGGKPES